MNKVVANKKDEAPAKKAGAARWDQRSLDKWHERLKAMSLDEIIEEKKQLENDLGSGSAKEKKNTEEKLKVLEDVAYEKIEEITGTHGWGC
ncbi:MAG: hypothetical protein QW035_02700 [Candidatus Anstonellales archaeon]